jgi:hypothetical protein
MRGRRDYSRTASSVKWVKFGVLNPGFRSSLVGIPAPRSTTVQPLILDIVETLLPLLAGLLAFAAGRWAGRLSRSAYFALVGVAVGIVVIAWPVHLFLDVWLGPWVFRVGGEAAPAMWAGLFLLGVVCMLPNRTLRTRFVVIVVGLVGTILFLQSGGRLLWRYGLADTWQHTADTHGNLLQSTGISCGPASAVMLLHHHGVTVSEGEMAYHAATGVTGTNLHALAEATCDKLGRPVRVERTDFDTLRQRGIDFIAAVKLPHVRSHAIYVAALTEEHAFVVDPLEGWRKRVPRAVSNGGTTTLRTVMGPTARWRTSGGIMITLPGCTGVGVPFNSTTAPGLQSST